MTSLISAHKDNSGFTPKPLFDALETTNSPIHDYLPEIEFRIHQAAYAHQEGARLNYYEIFFGPGWKDEVPDLIKEGNFESEVLDRFGKIIALVVEYQQIYDMPFNNSEVDPKDENSALYYRANISTLKAELANGYHVLTNPDLRESYDKNLSEVKAFWDSAPEDVRELPREHFHLRHDRSLIGIEGKSAIDNWGVAVKGSPMIREIAPELIQAIGWIKEANIRTQYDNGDLKDRMRPVVIPGQTEPVAPELVRDAIIQASQEFARGDYNYDFNLPMIQGGAGTSINMTANEIIANRANMILFAQLDLDARYDPKDLYNPGVHLIHPNDHVNFPNSTNDVVPTAMNLMCVMKAEKFMDLLHSVYEAVQEFAQQEEVVNTVALGRTHLQAAVPITYSQVFSGYSAEFSKAIDRINLAKKSLCTSTLGANAVGTGINSQGSYQESSAHFLGKVANENGFVGHIDGLPRSNLTATTWSLTDMKHLFGVMHEGMEVANKMANDIRYYVSADCGEIKIAPHQAGSSIMPGKINPTMFEFVNQAYQLFAGAVAALNATSSAGQLQLQVFGPAALHTFAMATTQAEAALHNLVTKGLHGMHLNIDRINKNLGESPALATGLNPIIGYKASAAVVEEMKGSNRNIWQVVGDDDFMSTLASKYSFDPSLIEKCRIELNPDSLIKFTRPID